jgi:putative transposase
MSSHEHLPHLSRIWITDPVYFITTCTYQRKLIIANSQVSQILVKEWTDALERHGCIVGRYVIMPDHVHFLYSFASELSDSVQNNISSFIQQWKQWTSKRIIREINIDPKKFISPIWQKEFFDHLVRSEVSYIQKWEYVRENPIRKNLVKLAEDWPW